MKELRGVLSLIITILFFSFSCYSQNLTTLVPSGMGMTKNYDFFVFILKDEGFKTLAMTFTNDTIHICPYVTNTKDELFFKAVSFYEFGHYYNYVSNHEVIKTDSLKQICQTKYNIGTLYWKTSIGLNNFTYKGSDGSSLKKAIMTKGISTMTEGIASEYAYLVKELGQRGINWKPIGQYLLPDYKKYFDVIKVKIINTSEIRYFYFDITNYFGQY